MPLALATSSEAELVYPAIERTGLAPLLDTVVLVRDVGVGKQSPDIFLECTRRLGMAPGECMVFEDIIEAVRTANAAGFQTCGVYEERYKDTFTLLQNEADHTIRSFSELLEAE